MSIYHLYCSMKVAEILKDWPSWYRDCRAVDVLNALSTGNGGTIELLYMQVGYYLIADCLYQFCRYATKYANQRNFC